MNEQTQRNTVCLPEEEACSVKMQINGERMVKSATLWCDKPVVAYVFIGLAVAIAVFCAVWAFTSDSMNVLLLSAFALFLAYLTFANVRKSKYLAKELQNCSIEYWFMPDKIVCVEYRDNKAVACTDCEYTSITKIKQKSEFIWLYVQKQSITLDKLGFIKGDLKQLTQLLSQKTDKWKEEE